MYVLVTEMKDKDAARQKLKELLAVCGSDFYKYPNRCEGGLQDYCAKYKPERNLLLRALQEEVPAALMAAKAKGLPDQMEIAKQVQRLKNNHQMTEEAATWAVESWAEALELSLQQQTPIAWWRKNQKYWIPGSIAVLVAMACIPTLSYLNYIDQIRKLNEATLLESKGDFYECIDEAGDVYASTSDDSLEAQASNLRDKCRLKWANQLIPEAKVSSAIALAKEIDSGSNYSKEAQDLIKKFSKGLEVEIMNNCKYPLGLLLSYNDPDANGSEKTDGWWLFASQGTLRPSNEVARIKILDPVYFYAKQINEESVKTHIINFILNGVKITGSDAEREYKGEKYEMKKIDLQVNDPNDVKYFLGTIECSNEQ
jgi:hypothetical protein